MCVRKFTDGMLEVLREQESKLVTKAAMGILEDINAVLSKVLGLAHTFRDRCLARKVLTAKSSTVCSCLAPDKTNDCGSASGCSRPGSSVVDQVAQLYYVSAFGSTLSGCPKCRALLAFAGFWTACTAYISPHLICLVYAFDITTH